MNKQTILKEYGETIVKEFELSMLLSNFDNNTEFSHSSFDLLILLQQNLNQKLKILEMIARTENINEIFDIQRKHFDKLTSTSGEHGIFLKNIMRYINMFVQYVIYIFLYAFMI